MQLSSILENAEDYRDAQRLLKASDLNNTAWQVEQWDVAMLETAVSIAQKWKNGFDGNKKALGVLKLSTLFNLSYISRQ